MPFKTVENQIKCIKFESMDTSALQSEIRKIAKEKGIFILAHSYQPMEIQEIADYVGDSLDLSKKAMESGSKKIMFCAVKFMAETASVLSPEKKIMIAIEEAGCPLANMITPEDVVEMKKKYPKAKVVCYINSPIEVKALSDVICTSANALKIVEKIDSDEIIFIPDQGLGSWIASKTKKTLHIFNGYCPIHWLMDADQVRTTKADHPDALLVSHPESNPKVRELSDHICGTSGMITYVKENPGRCFIIATETGMKQRLEKMFPGERFVLATKNITCPNMKKTTLEKLLESLREEKHVITVDKEIADKARIAIERMHG